MPRLRLLIALLLAAFAGTAPAALAQSTLTVPDQLPPLTRPTPPPTDTGGDGAPGQDGSSGEDAEADRTSSSAKATELPQTGSDETAALLLLGVALVLAGSGVRLRAGSPHGLR